MFEQWSPNQRSTFRRTEDHIIEFWQNKIRDSITLHYITLHCITLHYITVLVAFYVLSHCTMKWPEIDTASNRPGENE